MNVHFFSPPPAQRIGGLDAAIEGLRAALTRAGATVDDALPERADGRHVAHFHGLWQRGFGRLASRCAALGIPFVVSPHGMLEPWAMRHKWWKKWPYFHLIEKRFLARAAGLLATGRLEAARLENLLPHQCVESIPLGISDPARPDYVAARRTLNLPEDTRVLLFLSRLHVKKGLDLLIRALAKVERPGSARLIIVGTGEVKYLRAVHRLAARHEQALPPLSWMNEIWGEERWAYFQAADLFCLPTFSENFGLAVLEACQVGTPVLTTTTTPWGEHLDATRGYLCEPEADSVAAALTRFFAAPRRTLEDRRALSEWAWSTFAWDHLATRYLDFYSALS